MLLIQHHQPNAIVKFETDLIPLKENSITQSQSFATPDGEPDLPIEVLKLSKNCARSRRHTPRSKEPVSEEEDFLEDTVACMPVTCFLGQGLVASHYS
jgi:hypothetical protein